MARTVWLKPMLGGFILARLLALPGDAVWATAPADAASNALVPALPMPTAARPAAGGDHALDGLVRAVLADPSDADARKRLGGFWLEYGENASAAAQFEAVLAQDPEDAVALYQLAWAYGGLRDYEQAIAAARAATRAVPHWPEAWLRLGVLLIRDGQLTAGHEAVLRAVSGAGVSPEVYYEVGNLMLEQGAPEQAVPYFERALRWRPDSSHAANNLGNAHKALSHVEAARRAYEQAIAADPSNPNPRNALGVIFEEQGDVERALNHYHAATRVDPTYVDAIYNAGVLLLKQKRHAEAVSELLLASRLNPEFAMAHFQLGEALYGLGKLRRAVESHRRATALDPELTRRPGAVHDLLEEPGHDRSSGR